MNLLPVKPAAENGGLHFVLVIFGWVLFDTNTLTDAWTFLKAMFGANGVAGDSTSMYLFMNNIVIYAVCFFASTNIFTVVTSKIDKKRPTVTKYAAPLAQFCVLMICTAYLVDATYNPFLYFRF